MASSGRTAVLLLFLLMTPVGFGQAIITLTIQSPAPDIWVVPGTIPVNGTASGAAQGSLDLAGLPNLSNGTFASANLSANGSISLVDDGFTTVRYFENFSTYANGTSAYAVDAAWLGVGTNGSPFISPWFVTNQSSIVLSGAPSMGFREFPDYPLYWRMVYPNPITQAVVSFRFGVGPNTTMKFGAFANGSDLPGTELLNRSTPGNATFKADISSLVANRTSFYLSFYGYTPLPAKANEWVAFDDLTVDVSFRPQNGTRNVSFIENFTNAPMTPVWFSHGSSWRWTGSSSLGTGGAVHHGYNSGTDLFYLQRAAAPVVSAHLRFNYTCLFSGRFYVFAAPNVGLPEVELLNGSGSSPSTFDQNITPYIGSNTLALRFFWETQGTNFACYVDDFNLTVELDANPPGVLTGSYESPLISLGRTVDFDSIEYALATPGSSSVTVETRAIRAGPGWTNWTGTANGSALPLTTADAFQFRLFFFSDNPAELPSFMGGLVRFRAIERVAVSVDNGTTWTNATLTFAPNASSVSWRATMGLAPGENRIVVRALDTTGALSESRRSVFWDNFSPSEPGTPTDQGAFVNVTNLNWSWAAATDTGFGVAEYRVRLGTSPGFSNIVANASVGMNTTYSFSGAVNGTTYFLSVQARDGAGLWSGWNSQARGVLVDLAALAASKPGRASLWGNSSALDWTWASFQDSGSPVASYQVRVGSSPGGTDVVALDAVATPNYTLQGALHGGTYYIGVRGIDAAGNVGPWSASSDLARVDLGAPGIPGTLDGPQGFTNATSASWTWGAAADDLSGVDRYEVSAGSSSTGFDVVAPTRVASNGFVLPALAEGIAVYFRVRAVDIAGNAGAWLNATAPLTADRTAPSLPVLTAWPPLWTNATDLAWAWSDASDNLSGVVGFESWIGSAAGGSNVVPFQLVATSPFGLANAQEGSPYHFSVRAVDAAGNRGLAAEAPPVRVDMTAPPAPTNLRGPASPTGASPLAFAWDASADLGAGTSGYEIQVGSAVGAGDVMAWNFVPSPLFSFAGAQSGSTYFLSVRTVDAVGWNSQPSFLNAGILVDLGAPTQVGNLSLSTPISRNATVTVRWTAAGDLGGSGIEGYDVEVRQAGSSTVLRAGRTDFSIEVPGEDGVNYTISVHAVDRAGNVGPWAVGGTVFFDRTPPAAPSSVASRIRGDAVEVVWSPSTDGGSGVFGYRVSIGLTPGSSNVVAGAFVTEPSFLLNSPPQPTIYVTVTAVDIAGNEARDADAPVALNTQGPSILTPSTIGLFLLAFGATGVLGLVWFRRRSRPER